MAKETQSHQYTERSASNPSATQQHGDNPAASRGAEQYSAYAATESGQRSQDLRPWTQSPQSAHGLTAYDLWAPFGGGPFSMMRRLSEEMDRWFEGLSGGRPALFDYGAGGGARPATLWSPQIVVREREGKLVISADLPGVKREDLNVEIEPDAIVIRGERRETTSSNERGLYRSERMYGSFYRQIPLPEGANTQNAQATFRDGVLEIEIDVPKKAGSRRLEIKDVGTGTAGGTAIGAKGSTQYGS